MSDGRRDHGLDVLRRLSPDSSPDRDSLSAELGPGMADMVLDFCLGTLWTRPVLDDKTRSFIVLSALTALGDQRALRTHIKGALAHGATPEEVREVFVQLSGYAGFPRAAAAAELAETILADTTS